MKIHVFPPSGRIVGIDNDAGEYLVAELE